MDTNSSQLIVLKELRGNNPTHLSGIQPFLAPHIELLTTLWIAIWFATALALLGILFKEYRAYRRQKHRDI
ncbi:MAG: hypothetical protein RIQ56_615 [Candidatus Parcubacteria bacterium]|jgi:hypothetical protein